MESELAFRAAPRAIERPRRLIQLGVQTTEIQDHPADHRADRRDRDGIRRNDETKVRIAHHAPLAANSGASRSPSTAASMVTLAIRRRRISLRIAIRCSVRKRQVKASDITISGMSSSGAIVGPSRRNTDAGWCKVFHQSTENLM